MNEIKLSICIPTFNRARALEELLESLRRETGSYPSDQVEVVVSDNASSDDTGSLCERYQEALPSFRYSRNPTNLMFDGNLLACRDLARGEYLWIVGDDDAVVPGGLARLLKHLDSGHEIYLSPRIECDESMKPLRLKEWFSPGLPPELDLAQRDNLKCFFDHAQELGGIFSYISSQVFRTELWRVPKTVSDPFLGSAYLHIYLMLNATRKGPFRLKLLPDPLVFCRLEMAPTGQPHWAYTRGRWDLDALLGFSFFMNLPADPELAEAFFGVLRRNHKGLNMVSAMRQSAPDEKQWFMARERLLMVGFKEDQIRSIENGFALQQAMGGPKLLLESSEQEAQLPSLVLQSQLALGAERSLLVILGEGDEVMAATQAIPVLARNQGDASRRFVLCDSKWALLFAGCPHISDVITVDTKALMEQEGARQSLDHRLKSLEIQFVLNLGYRRHLAGDLAVGMAHGNLTVGFSGHGCQSPAHLKQETDRWYSRLLDLSRHEGNALEAVSKLLLSLGFTAPQGGPQLWFCPSTQRYLKAHQAYLELDPSHSVVLACGGRVFTDPLIWVPTLQGLKRRGFQILAVGEPGFRAWAQQALEAAGGGLNLVDERDFESQVVLLQGCRLLLGHESDWSHVATAMGIPQVLALGGGEFGRWMPALPHTTAACLPLDCYGCGWTCPWERRHCLEDLDPTLLLDCVQWALEGDSNRPRLMLQSRFRPPRGNQPRWLDLEGHLNPREVRYRLQP